MSEGTWTTQLIGTVQSERNGDEARDAKPVNAKPALGGANQPHKLSLHTQCQQFRLLNQRCLPIQGKIIQARPWHPPDLAGGLVYNRDFSSPLSKLSSNDYLVLAGTFHGVHAITRSLTPSPIISSVQRSQLTGLEVLESSNFRLTCFQTPTGVKFLLFTEPHQPNCDAIVGKVYEFYADYVMKNPFYALEMPVRCEEFDRRLGAWIRGR
ncbi:MAG: hypothetical protein Q9170_001535 [Blastenia crenularia]